MFQGQIHGQKISEAIGRSFLISNISASKDCIFLRYIKNEPSIFLIRRGLAVVRYYKTFLIKVTYSIIVHMAKEQSYKWTVIEFCVERIYQSSSSTLMYELAAANAVSFLLFAHM